LTNYRSLNRVGFYTLLATQPHWQPKRPMTSSGQAIVAAGFGAWLRPGELRKLDRCDWIPHASTSTAQHRIAEIRIGRRWRCGPPQPHFLENQNLRHPSTAPPPAPPPFSSAPCCPGTAPYRTSPMPPGDHPVATTPGPHFCKSAPRPSRRGLVAAGPFSAFFLFPNIFDRFSAGLAAIRSILFSHPSPEVMQGSQSRRACRLKEISCRCGSRAADAGCAMCDGTWCGGGWWLVAA
jgi:hypothetical protein